MSDPREAKAEGINFYCLPEEIDYENDIDPLIRGIVKRINESNLVWSAESCQGHPDSVEDHPWGFNNKPMLRLVCARDNLPFMLYELLCASYNEDGYPCRRSVGLELYLHQQTKNWAEILVYIPAHNTYGRNIGLEAFARFAENIN